MLYHGKFEWFSEMGMEGASLIFVDDKAKYLSGYEQLDLSYFFKNFDQFHLVINFKDELVFNNMATFVYNGKYGSVLPQEIDVKKLKEWINGGASVGLSTTKKLYGDKIILKASGIENEFLLENIKKLMKTPDSKLSQQFIGFKKEFKIVDKCLKEFQKMDPKNQAKFNFDTYIVEPSSYLFGSKPIEVILRGDGAHLVEWLQERAGFKKPNPNNY